MDDNVSHDSDDSIPSSDGFEIIQTLEPELKIAGNGCIEDLKQTMSEVLMDSDMSVDKNPVDDGKSILDKNSPAKTIDLIDSNKLASHEKAVLETDKEEKMGEKVEAFEAKDSANDNDDNVTPYAVYSNPLQESNGLSPPSFSTLPDGSEGTLFYDITYLGAATVNDGRDEKEMSHNMSFLNAQAIDHAIQVTFAVPSTPDGSIVLFEPNSSQEIASFKIHRVSYCTRGDKETPEAICFAFTCSHGDGSDSSSIFHQCHVFKCNSEEQVSKVVMCFCNAFGRDTKLLTAPKDNLKLTDRSFSKVQDEEFVFEVSLEIREEDAKGNYNASPKDKACFKLRSNLPKMVIVTVQQIVNKDLTIERCFGLLMSSNNLNGNIHHGDMHLLDDMSMNVTGSERRQYTITGYWNPTDPIFENLNAETKDSRVPLNVAVDLIIGGIQQPVRFCMETKAKIFPQTERFWYYTRKHLTERFHVYLKEDETHGTYEVVRLENRGEPEYKRLGLSLNLRGVSNNLLPPISTPIDPDEESDNDEPLLSGSGEVSKNCTEGELEGWADFLRKWPPITGVKQRPKQLVNLVRRGIPEALRGEVWPRLVGVSDSSEMMDTYRILITKDSSCEQVIQRDINRTFPAHDFFKENGGIGQDALYKISKAYSVYDEEVGYCQGLSFLAAALLLHMPEEQAFFVLVKIMFDYHLRDLFKDNFEVLHLRFYQLERMIEDQIPDLYVHFSQMGVEAHMFGSQWFLTLFTAKFPLFLVFHILDIFLCEGMDTIFQVALALLMMSKKELLTMDFEGILKYFRVALPKKYRSEETARQLLRSAVQIKIKKLKKYEKDYVTMKEQELQQENPVERLERENKRLMETNLRLEQENDDIAHELVTSKINLRKDLDKVEDKAEALNKELLATKSTLVDTEEEKKRLEFEAAQVKEMCRRELQRSESEIERNNAIIAEYKQICSQLSSRLEKEQKASKETLGRLKEQIKGCKQCSDLIGNHSMGFIVCSNQEAGDPQLADALQQIRELELELAQTKLAFVEAQCRNQDLTHQLNSALSELQSSKNTWLQKTLTSIREVTKKDSNAATRENV